MKARVIANTSSAIGVIAWTLFGLTMWWNVFLDFEQYGPVPFSRYLHSMTPGAAVFYLLPIVGTVFSLAALWLTRNGRSRVAATVAMLSLVIVLILAGLSIWGTSELAGG
jgi:hypothetical protein